MCVGEREKEREIHLLVHSSNICSAQGWTKAKVRDWRLNLVPPCGARQAQLHQPSPSASLNFTSMKIEWEPEPGFEPGTVVWGAGVFTTRRMSAPL